MSSKKVRSIKAALSRIIYLHLLLYPRRIKLFNADRIGTGFYDWDLVTCLNEIRRYLYGGLKQETLDSFLSDKLSIRRMKGLMAYYCLIDDHEQLHGLDGWLVSVIRRAIVERSKVLAKLGHELIPLSRQQILSGDWYNYPTIPQEMSCPSFFLSWRAARKKWERHGVSGIGIPPDAYFYDL
jgi:hypothetical protein